jgi:integrase
MGPGEVMGLRRKDIDLEKKTVAVNPYTAKTRGRIRLIPFNNISERTFREALAIAEKKASVLPDIQEKITYTIRRGPPPRTKLGGARC